MSMGRGRGGPPQMPQHQGGQDRRELRRPMQGNPEDVARGLARMDLYGNRQGYGNFPNNSGNSYGGPMGVPPPRPAPSADGWSSGENQYDVYNQQSQHMAGYHNQPHMGQPSWNIGASEFVPKSNLSAAAAGFVPRIMPRNTSQWGYQNQPPSQAQQNFYQDSPEPQQSSYHQQSQNYGMQSAIVNPYLTDSSGSGAGSLYNVEEQLTDAIATIVYMPTKLDRTCSTLADKINSSTTDPGTLDGLANCIFDLCFSDVNFRPIAGQFCAVMAKNVRLDFDGCSMLTLLIDKCQTLHSSHLELMSTDPHSANFIVEFLSKFLYHVDALGCPRIHRLADVIFEIFNSLLIVGSQNPENLILASEMLKICGRAIENDEKRRSGDPNADEAEIRARPSPRVDELMTIVSKMSTDADKFSPAVRESLKSLLDARANGTWGSASFIPALPAASNEVTKPRSNAIVIEPDPNDVHIRSNNVVISNNARNYTRGTSSNSGQEMTLTEEELAFMNEHMGGGETSSPGESDLVGNTVSTSGDEDDMPDDIRAAYGVFLQEQSNAQKRK